jgi:hypothetical protein
MTVATVVFAAILLGFAAAELIGVCIRLARSLGKRHREKGGRP